MSDKYQDDQLNSDELSLEAILAEFGADKPRPTGPDLPWPESKRTPKPQNVVLFPEREAPSEEPEEEEEPEEAVEEALPPEAPPPPPVEKVVTLPKTEPKVSAQPKGQPATVVEFPEEEVPPPLQAGIEHLKRKADAFSQQMFQEEGVEYAPETRRAEALIPGVDVEKEPPPPRREEKQRRPAPDKPDTPPGDLVEHYRKGQGLLRLRAALVFLLLLPQLWLSFAPILGLPLPEKMVASFEMQVLVLTLLLLTAMVLGCDLLLRGLWHLVTLRADYESMVALTCLAVLADGYTQCTLQPQRTTLPYAVAATLCLFSALRGRYVHRQGMASACRHGGTVSQPYVVSLDEEAWNGKDTYVKWEGTTQGFGSQIQMPDLAQKAYRVAAPLFILGAVACAVLVSIGRDQGSELIWCLAVLCTAATGCAGLTIFGRPFRRLVRRLGESGAAIPGWSACEGKGNALLVTDNDLFPPSTVAPNGFKIFDGLPVDRVLAPCASVIRASGSGLDKVFSDLMRAQGCLYRKCTQLERHEAGGLSAMVRDQQVLVGSAAFMNLMQIELPEGHLVQNAAFCAIDGQLAGIFALNYQMRPAIAQAIQDLVDSRLTPVLVTRDFNLIPALLRKRFQLPADQMDFPSVERRTQLSDPDAEHNPWITALLTREGLTPLVDAVIGVKRLRTAVVLSTALTMIGSLVGLLMTFYLTYMGAYDAIAPAQLTLFLLAWWLPVVLISNWVDRY